MFCVADGLSFRAATAATVRMPLLQALWTTSLSGGLQVSLFNLLNQLTEEVSNFAAHALMLKLSQLS